METVAVLLIAGTLLVLLETVLPGMVAGIIGSGCLLSGVVVAYSKFGPAVGNRVLLGVTLGFLVLCGLWVRFFPNSRFGRVFIASNTIGSLGVERPELVDRTGTALTILRPSGTALIDGKRVDVVTEGGFIDAGTPIKIVAVEGLRVIVRTT